jgi:hypothetical protein
MLQFKVVNGTFPIFSTFVIQFFLVGGGELLLQQIYTKIYLLVLRFVKIGSGAAFLLWGVN